MAITNPVIGTKSKKKYKIRNLFSYLVKCDIINLNKNTLQMYEV